MSTNAPGLRREGKVFFVMPRTPQDHRCLVCNADVDNEEIPYYEPCRERNGTEYVLCFDHASAAWQEEVIEYEQGIEAEKRYLPEFLLD